MAAEKNHPSLIQFLINRGVNWNVRNEKNGKTAFHIALEHSSMEVFDMLIEVAKRQAIPLNEKGENSKNKTFAN